MSQSTNGPDGRRPGPPPLPGPRDPGYEVLPEDKPPVDDGRPYEVLPDDDKEYHRPAGRRLAEFAGRDLRPPPRQRDPLPRPGVMPLKLLAGACAVATPLTGLIAVAGLVLFVGLISRGHWPGRLLFGAMMLFAILAQYYARIALGIWRGRTHQVELGRCAVASLAVGGFAAMFALPLGLHTLGSGDASGLMVALSLAGILVVGLLVLIGGLAVLALGQRKSGRPRRPRS